MRKIKNLKWRGKYPIKNGIPVFLAKLDNFKKQEKELAESQAEKYDILAKKNWFPNKDVYQKALEPILNLPEKSLVLELGGGVSYTSVLILKKSLRLIETDIALKTVLQTKRYLARQNLTKNASFLVCDAEKIPFSDKTFDAVFLVSTFHHFPHQKKALREIKRVVRANGLIVFVAEPNRWPYQTIFPLTKKVRYYLRAKRIYDSPADEETKGYRQKDFSALFAKAGLEIITINPTLLCVQFYGHFLLFCNRSFRMKLKRKEKTEKILNKIDDFLAKIPIVNNFFWHWSVVGRKPTTPSSNIEIRNPKHVLKI